MSLDEYQKKRDFSRTPEPGPAGLLEEETGGGATEKRRFVIQKHVAGNIHYDLRLEHGGTLKSWAVPKGLPTPHERHKLAVRVEDHPLDYLTFTGTIPRGEYGAGKVSIWDAGVYAPAQDPATVLQKGKLTVRLEGDKVRGEFTLVHMRGRGYKVNDWLIILGNTGGLNLDLKTQGEAAPLPDRIKPMLAAGAEKPFSSPDYYFEVKFDGVRALSYIDAEGLLSVRSRSQKEQSFRYPELADLAAHFLASQIVADGEIVALDSSGVSRFQLLQGRINLSAAAAERAVRSTPVFYYVFDILYLDGRDLSSLPFQKRRRILERVLMPHEHVRLSESVPERGEAMFEFARQRDLEGIIAKRGCSPYRQKRSRDWLKIKAVHEQEFVIGGFTGPKGGRAYFGALLLGVYDGSDLIYAGNVGTGFADESLGRLHGLMEPLVQDEPPFRKRPRANEPATWLRPELVAEVRFSEWTREGLLRQPVFLGIRDDLDPKECVREEEGMAGPAPEAANAPAVQPPLKFPPRPEFSLEMEGKKLRLTNLNKKLWPDEGLNKADFIDYYHRVSRFILPHLRGRPLTLKRYPDGIGKPYFFQKEAPPEAPGWIRTEPIASRHGKRGRIRYIVCEDEATLLYLANLACISLNPWLSRLPRKDRPDIISFDLDPLDPMDFEACIKAALLVREKLAGFGLKSYPKTSGATGIHVFVPVRADYDFEQARRFAEVIAILCRQERPDLITLEQPLERRSGKRLYLDFRQNVKGKTLASAYSVRARPGAPVSTPLKWNEIKEGLRPTDFTMLNIPARLEETGDLFAPAQTNRQDLLAALEKGRRLVTQR